MKPLPLLLILAFVLTACGQRMSPQEGLLLSTISRIEVAMGYERHCVKPADKTENASANLTRNIEQVSYMMADEIVKHMDGTPTDEEKQVYAEERLYPYVNGVRAKIEEAFKKEGCESPLAAEGKALYDFFSTVTPEQFHPVLMEELKKVSGEAPSAVPQPVPTPAAPASGPMSTPAS